MKVLTISRDSNALVPGTSTFKRMEEYRRLVDELRVFVPGRNWNIFGRWDVVSSQDPFETGVIAWLLSVFFGAKLHLQIHTDFLALEFQTESLKNKVRVMLADFLIPRADCIRVVSKRIAGSLNNRGYKMKVEPTVLPISVNLPLVEHVSDELNLHRKYPGFETIILMASRITHEKNISFAINAMRDVVRLFPMTGLVIVGDGEEKKNLISHVYKYGLEKNVVFEKQVADLSPYYRTSDMFLLTSLYEGYGMTLVESALAGCPIVTTDVGLVGDLLTSDDLLVVSMLDVSDLSTKLMRLVGSVPLRHKLSERGRLVIKRLPSKEEYLRLYKESWQKCGV